MDTEKLKILHEHHQDTFSYIRERERQRDRLFLIVAALFSTLSAAIVFSADFIVALRSVRLAGSQVNLSSLPAGVIIDSIWVFVFAVTLRYCQVCITIERQYSYLHLLEATLSDELDGSTLYLRESRAYLDNYPSFSQWAWISYVYVFPILAIVTSLGMILTEWIVLQVNWSHKALDTAVGAAVCATLFLYRLLPARSKRHNVDG